MSRFALLADIGSTFTKASVAELEEARIVCSDSAPTVTGRDAAAGFARLKEKLLERAGISRPDLCLASSSAAGGLRVVATGLMKDLTVKAAKTACLNAGAYVVRSYCGRLGEEEVREIDRIMPDIILLAGGTDGGDDGCVLHNAEKLDRLRSGPAFLYAGNRAAAEESGFILSGRELYFAENVMPELSEMNIEPAREKIREIFLGRIAGSSRLQGISSQLNGPMMPTPMAVFNAVVLLAGKNREEGIAGLLAVDAGGATTDVFSAGPSGPFRAGTVLKGLPEPYAKRTVEGDIGVRSSAGGVLAEASRGDSGPSGRLEGWVRKIMESPHIIPSGKNELMMDALLAGEAARAAVARHCGRLEERYSPAGKFWVQEGKDLSRSAGVVATGGVFSRNPFAPGCLKEAFLAQDSDVLCPRRPEILVDSRYFMYAAGLLSEHDSRAAARILKKESLRVWN